MDTNSGRSANHTYSLRQLLGENITIVIPDMQRDYCWGSEGKSGKVTTFMTSILSLYRTGLTSSLGLLYGYEASEGSDHIHIIDGQQRITTLYLLVGMLYRRTPREDLRRMLISDYELIDDREPRLLYEVRAEAMYFMSELVTHFFLNRDGRLSQLENSPWYCQTYSTDPTVRSFIGAIRKIDEAIESACHDEGWDFDDFADFVTERLVFFYHDLATRATAEEMFVTINTTGEPLTLPQRLKAMLPPAPGNIRKWEEIEQWAWEHRTGRSGHRPSTSDARLTSLIHIWEKYSGKDFRALTTDFTGFYNFFLSYRTLCECMPDAIDARPEVPADMFAVLPAVRFIEKWSLSPRDKEMISAFTSLLSNVTRYQRVSPAGSDTENAFRMVDMMAFPDVISLLDLPENIAPKILSAEEKAKLRVIAENPGKRAEATRILRDGELHPLLYGNLHKVIAWCYDKNSRHTDLTRLEHYIKLVYEIWGTDIDQRADLDILRRAMLTLRHTGYPMQKRADTTLSLCWREYEWQRLMNSSPGVIRQLIDRVAEGQQRPAEMFRKMIDRFDDKTYPFYFLISSAEMMARCLHRSLLRYCKPFIGYYVTDSYSSKPVTHWIIDGNKVEIDTATWTVMRPYGSRCLYTDHRWLNVAVDIHYLSEHTRGYRIEVFSRAYPSEKEPVDLRPVLGRTGRKFSFDKKTRKFYTILPDARTAVGTLHTIFRSVRKS